MYKVTVLHSTEYAGTSNIGSYYRQSITITFGQSIDIRRQFKSVNILLLQGHLLLLFLLLHSITFTVYFILSALLYIDPLKCRQDEIKNG